MTTQQAAADAARNVPAAPRRSVLLDMASRFGMEPNAFEATVRSTCIPGGATREQFAAFLAVARDYGLNPLTREIYAFPAKGGGVVPIVGIDGWLALANRRAEFDGLETIDDVDEKGNLVSVTAIVYRKDRGHPAKVTEYLDECRRGTEPWKQWPRRMLRHKATIQAIRYAFSISGIYEPDEAERGDLIDVTPPRPTRADFESEGGAPPKAKPAPLPDDVPRADQDLRPADAAAAAGTSGAKTPAAVSDGGDHVTAGQEGAGERGAPSEAAERDADRMMARAARGESTDEAEEDVAPEFAVTPIPLKKGGEAPDWIKWHTLVVAAAKSVPADHRPAFLAAHEPALGNYAAVSPDNAKSLRALILGDAP